MTHVLVKRWPREDRGRDWNYLPRNIWGYQKLEEVEREPPPEPWGRAGPCQLLDSRLLASRTIREETYVVLSLLVCGSLF